MYGPDPDGTPWIRGARTRGMIAADGLHMLVEQAAISVARWFDREAPFEPMKRAALRALGRLCATD